MSDSLHACLGGERILMGASKIKMANIGGQGIAYATFVPHLLAEFRKVRRFMICLFVDFDSFHFCSEHFHICIEHRGTIVKMQIIQTGKEMLRTKRENGKMKQHSCLLYLN
jgi:hypothetical protein